MATSFDYITIVIKRVLDQEAHHILHEELGFDEDKTKKLIKVYDRNGDGHLSYEEFIWFYWKIQEK